MPGGPRFQSIYTSYFNGKIGGTVLALIIFIAIINRNKTSTTQHKLKTALDQLAARAKVVQHKQISKTKILSGVISQQVQARWCFCMLIQNLYQ